MDEWEQVRSEQIADPADVGEQAIAALAHEQYVRALWPEVRSLPLRQRWALLLHLEKDEVLTFVQYGCCSLRQVAESLEVPAQEFAGWFGQLPLPDDRLATRMGLTRRQVINLRKCARERLSRRLKAWEEI